MFPFDDVIMTLRCPYDTETLFATLVLYEGNPPVIDGFPSQRPVMISFKRNDFSLLDFKAKQQQQNDIDITYM